MRKICSICKVGMQVIKINLGIWQPRSGSKCLLIKNVRALNCKCFFQIKSKWRMV